MLWEFKHDNSAKATVEKICSVYAKSLISDRTVRSLFAKFHFGDTNSRKVKYITINCLPLLGKTRESQQVGSMGKKTEVIYDST